MAIVSGSFETVGRSFFVATALLATLVGCSGKQNSAGSASASSTPAAAPMAPRVTSYSTDFKLKEDPISEGGRWISGKTEGFDWGDVSTFPGYAVGHAGPKRFADSVALLTGDWGPNQTVEAVVEKRKITRYPEVSLRLRSLLRKHDCQGYEISYSLNDNAYLIIVRWNGPLADFTYLVNTQGREYAVKTGDVVKATISGNVITTYKNGVQMAQVKDNTYLNGSPGFGFNEGKNGDFGIRRFSVTTSDAPIAAGNGAVQ
jgi:uncharacterized lipoprotein NlpE involved in copper resistance